MLARVGCGRVGVVVVVVRGGGPVKGAGPTVNCGVGYAGAVLA